jgi:hypothetical protein
MNPELLRQKLPEVESWVARTVAAQAAQAQPVASFGFARLGDYYPASLLQTAKVVSVPTVPVPPLAELGLPGFEDFEQLDHDGITYLDTYFVCADLLRDESLHFHELVHVNQWIHLGPRNFILAYALGHKISGGYRTNPFEVTAYDLQARFEAGEPAFDAAAIARAHATRDFWTLMRHARLA